MTGRNKVVLLCCDVTQLRLQVFEYYREGVSGGGYYKMDIKLLNNDGKVRL